MNIEIMTFIEQRMKEFGHDKYHVQPLYITLQSGQEKVKVDAFNEFLFLVSDNFPEDIIIQSDTNVFISAGNNPFINLPQEFRGQVFIESNLNDESILEFIRVIPE
jgi:hypothetical protein